MFIGGRSAESLSGSESVADDESFTFVETEADEDLGMSQHMMDSLVLGAGSQLENEEYLMAISRRLQTASYARVFGFPLSCWILKCLQATPEDDTSQQDFSPALLQSF